MPKPTDSSFWKALLKAALEVHLSGCIKLREGKVSFQFDKWFEKG